MQVNLDLSHFPSDVDPSVEVVAVKGEVDCYTAPQLRQALCGLIEAGRTRIAVDLSQCEFFDSSGIGVLIGARKLARPAGGGISVASPQSRVAKAFRILALHRVMPVVESVAAAVAQCPAGQQYVALEPVQQEQDGLFPAPPAPHPELDKDIAEYLTDRLYAQAGGLMILGGGKHRVLTAEELATLGLGTGDEDNGPLVFRRESDGALFEVAVSVHLTRVAAQEMAAR